MTAPLYRLAAGTVAGLGPGDRVVLDGSEGHHAATVKRARVGEPLLLADGGDALVHGTVAQVGAGSVVVRVEAIRREGQDGPRFVLVQALAKGDRDLQAVEAATELGVDEVVPWQAHRCVVRWRGERAERSRDKWVRLVAAAAQQSRRPSAPTVSEAVSLPRLLERAGAADAAYVLHESAAEPLAAVELPDSGEVLVVVGPEGGITEEEIAALAAAGATPVRLGRHVLRSSSAGPAALAVLSATRRWR